MRTIFFIALFATIIAFAQAPTAQTNTAALSGTIDGGPLPSRLANVQDEAVTSFMVNHQRQPTSSDTDQQEITTTEQMLTCRYLKTAVQAAGIIRAKADLGVSVTPQDIAVAKQQYNYKAPDPQILWAQEQERTHALVAGLTAVYDQSQDPQQVYQQMIAAHKIGQKDWLVQMYSHRTKAARDRLAQTLNRTPDYYAKGLSDPNTIKYFAEGLKLQTTVDRRLAATDPTFSTYLNEYNLKATHPDPYSTAVALPLAHVQYLAQKRAAWWQAENSKVQLSLSNPSVASQCMDLTNVTPVVQ